MIKSNAVIMTSSLSIDRATTEVGWAVKLTFSRLIIEQHHYFLGVDEITDVHGYWCPFEVDDCKQGK